jgi:hypothetical protein
MMLIICIRETDKMLSVRGILTEKVSVAKLGEPELLPSFQVCIVVERLF